MQRVLLEGIYETAALRLLWQSQRDCQCGPTVIQKYRQHISGPFMDRIDLHVEVFTIEYKELASKETTESSQKARERVEKARALQRERFKRHGGTHTNSAMTPRIIRRHRELDPESAGYLEHAMTTSMNFSVWVHDRILKVARTLADLTGDRRSRASHPVCCRY